MGFKTDLGDSAYDFMRLVYPKMVECKFISGSIVPIESVTSTGVTKDLDTLAGIDAWHINRTRGMQGIASRIQWGDKIWGSFTIRKHRTSGAETEYAKRKRAIDTDDWLYPVLTVQAYITSRRIGELLAVGVAKTKDVFRAIDDGRCTPRTNGRDGNEFIAVYWENVNDIQTWRL